MRDATKDYEPRTPGGATHDLAYHLQRALHHATILDYMTARSGGADMRLNMLVLDLNEAVALVKLLRQFVEEETKEMANAG